MSWLCEHLLSSCCLAWCLPEVLTLRGWELCLRQAEPSLGQHPLHYCWLSAFSGTLLLLFPAGGIPGGPDFPRVVPDRDILRLGKNASGRQAGEGGS